MDARAKPGSGGQFIAFVPSLDLVVTRQTGSSGDWEFEQYLRRACAAVLATPLTDPALANHIGGDDLIGTSGFQYPEWKGLFYPEKFSTAKMLPYYAERFPTTEINYTFNRIPTVKVLDHLGECNS
jgi:hypothetical protein